MSRTDEDQGNFYDTKSKWIKAEIEKQEELDKKRDVSDMQKIISLPEGRRLFWRILMANGLYVNPFNENGLRMAKHCGMQAVAQNVINMINEANAESFAQMQREYYSEMNSREKERQRKMETLNA